MTEMEELTTGSVLGFFCPPLVRNVRALSDHSALSLYRTETFEVNTLGQMFARPPALKGGG